MASREDLAIIRNARAGQVTAQVALGQRYLFGGGGLPQSMATALHWLIRAARQNSEAAWLLIGRHVPYEVAAPSSDSASLCQWYERAFDAGIEQAGLVFARLILTRTGSSIHPDLKHKAILALELAAKSGLPDAQRLLSELAPQFQPSTPPSPKLTATRNEQDISDSVALAHLAIAKQEWDLGNHDAFLKWALPLAREISQRQALIDSSSVDQSVAFTPSPQEAQLLSRCALVLARRNTADNDEVQLFWELAAHAGDETAPYALGLWLAKIDERGTRAPYYHGTANFKKAINWLTLAGERGSAPAWFALSRIFLKPHFPQNNLHDAQHYLKRAAEMGHPVAQLECGLHAWRLRHEQEMEDVNAAYWLGRSAAQGNHDAALLLEKVAPRPKAAAWALAAQRMLTKENLDNYPLFVARINLAAVFGLSKPEALLLDLNSADQGHCLLVDIRAHYGRGKRRLISLHTAQERLELNRIAKVFENVEKGERGPEGNYRQRMYRLKSLLPELAAE